MRPLPHEPGEEQTPPRRTEAGAGRWARALARHWLGATGLALLVLLMLALGAIRHAPSFYLRESTGSAEQIELASAAFLERAAALTGVDQHCGLWRTRFSEAELNGWLAGDFERNLSSALPPGFHEPRIDLEPDGARLACRWGQGWLSTVCSVHFAAELTSANVLAVRLYGARAGAVPIPLGGILHAISQAAQSGGWQLRWQQHRGDPVAVLTIPGERRSRRSVWVQRLAIGDNELELAGQTEELRPPQTESDSPQLAEESADHSPIQR